MSEQEPQYLSEDQTELLRIKEEIERQILAKVLSTWEGRRVLFNLIGKGDLYGLQGQMPFENEKVHRLIGRQEVAQEILLEALQADPAVYILMQRESGEFEAQFKLKEQPGSDEDE